MTQTRADLERKLEQLQERARQLTPRRVVQRSLPDYFADRVIGSILTLAGVRMAWKQIRSNRSNGCRPNRS
jgi:hypothetical protein